MVPVFLAHWRYSLGEYAHRKRKDAMTCSTARRQFGIPIWKSLKVTVLVPLNALAETRIVKMIWLRLVSIQQSLKLDRTHFLDEIQKQNTFESPNLLRWSMSVEMWLTSHSKIELENSDDADRQCEI